MGKCFNKNYVIYCVCASILIAICLTNYAVNLFDIGYTTYDDFSVSLWRKSSLLDIAKEKAIHQGRFAFYLVVPLTYLPFVINNSTYYHIMTFVPVLLCYSSFVYLAYRLIADETTILYIAIIYLVFIQNSWDHNLLTSYPFFITFALTCCFGSLAFYHRYITNNSKGELTISLILFGTSLVVHEVFVLYIFLFIVIDITYRLERRLRSLVPYIVLIAVYLLAYVLFRYYNPSTYKGTMIATGNIAAFFSVLWKYSLSAFPPFEYLTSSWIFNRYLDLPGTHEWSIFYLIKNSRALWLIQSLLTGVVTYLFLSKSNGLKLRGRLLTSLVCFSVLLIFLPNILIAMTPKYQDWAADGSYGYLTTFYSYFGAILFIVTILRAIVDSISQSNAKIAFSVTVAACMAWIALCISYSNHYYFKSQRQANLRLSTFNQIVGSNLINDKSIILSPSLCSKHSQHGIFKNDPIGYTLQSRINLNKDILVSKYDKLQELSAKSQEVYGKYFKEFDSAAIDARDVYTIKYMEEGKEYKSAAIITKKSADMATRQCIVFNNSNYNILHLTGRVYPQTNAIIKVNEKTYIVQNGFFSEYIEFGTRDGISTVEILSMNGTIDIDSISISYM